MCYIHINANMCKTPAKADLHLLSHWQAKEKEKEKKMKKMSKKRLNQKRSHNQTKPKTNNKTLEPLGAGQTWSMVTW